MGEKRLSYRELHSNCNFGCGKFQDFQPDAVVFDYLGCSKVRSSDLSIDFSHG